MESTNNFRPKIGEIYLMQFGGSQHEQTGVRPGLIVQNNVGNRFSPNVIALPLTSVMKKQNMPTHVLLRASEGGLAKDSIVLCEGPERMSKGRVRNYITTLAKDEMAEIAKANLLASSLISYLSLEELIEVWKEANELNATTQIV